MRLKIKVIPGSKKGEIVGWYGEQLKIRVSPPPEKGRANKAIIDLLAAVLNVPATSIVIVSGHSGPNKIVEIANLSHEQALVCLPNVGR